MFGRNRVLMTATMAMMGAFSHSAEALEIRPTYSIPSYTRSASGVMLYATTRGKGPSAAQIKRASNKAKNVRRHRAAVRG